MIFEKFLFNPTYHPRLSCQEFLHVFEYAFSLKTRSILLSKNTFRGIEELYDCSIEICPLIARYLT